VGEKLLKLPGKTPTPKNEPNKAVNRPRKEQTYTKEKNGPGGKTTRRRNAGRRGFRKKRLTSRTSKENLIYKYRKGGLTVGESPANFRGRGGVLRSSERRTIRRILKKRSGNLERGEKNVVVLAAETLSRPSSSSAGKEV